MSGALPGGRDHSAFCRLFSLACWSLRGLLREVIRAGLGLQQALGKARPFVVVAVDDTLFKKAGGIRGLARWLYDGTSGRFRPHIAKGLRWIHAALVGQIRADLDELGLTEQPLLFVVDGSYTNRNFLKGLPERTLVVGRV